MIVVDVTPVATFFAVTSTPTKRGFDPLMGARPMSRLIQDTIRRALADELLFGKLANGGKVTVDIDQSDKITLKFSEEKVPETTPEA